MRISILTLFPEMFSGPFNLSIIGRAQTAHHIDIRLVQLRDFATDRYKSVDDHPYGGGAGMILRVDVVDRALKAMRKGSPSKKTHTVLLDPQGGKYREHDAQRLAAYTHLILVCGHYEGVDERIRSLVDEELSIGDYVVTGGELPAMVITDSIVRLLPGVLRSPQAALDESFGPNGLEYPQYTRPETYKHASVPPVLLSGNHSAIADWRAKQSRSRTGIRRPDLLTEQTDSASTDR